MEGNIYCLRNSELFYVGSTERDLNTRLVEHKSDAKRNKSSSKLIIEQGDYEIYLIEKCPLDDLKKREGEIIKEFKNLYGSMCVNELIPGRGWKQRRLDNPKPKKIRTRQTAEEIAAKRAVLIECECGIPYTLLHKSRHSKTQRHLNNLKK
tara:strand:+ start:72 stop:524 length:453 start_codon:yes stop_codon:yes gene_type:complete